MSKIITDKVITKDGGVPEMLKLVDFTEKESGRLDFGNFQIIWGKGIDQGDLGGAYTSETITYPGGGFATKTMWAYCFPVSRNNAYTEISILHYWNRDDTTNTQIVIDMREQTGQNQTNWCNGYIAIGY